jgi:hypothetical protein
MIDRLAVRRGDGRGTGAGHGRRRIGSSGCVRTRQPNEAKRLGSFSTLAFSTCRLSRFMPPRRLRPDRLNQVWYRAPITRPKVTLDLEALTVDLGDDLARDHEDHRARREREASGQEPAPIRSLRACLAKLADAAFRQIAPASCASDPAPALCRQATPLRGSASRPATRLRQARPRPSG